MPVVQDIVTSLTGAPLGGVQVTIQLVTATPPGFISSGHQTILSTSKLYTAADGSWSATLIGNSGISPVGTVYRITYRNNGRVIKKFLVTVNISGGPYWVGNMATSIGISVPGPPQSLQAATGTVNGYVNLTWLAPSYAGTAAITAYKVQRDTGSGYSTVATLGSVLSYQDSIGASVTGAYRVIATNSVGDSVASNVAVGTGALIGSPPGAPTGMAASSGTVTGACDISWTAPSSSGSGPITGYEIERNAASAGFVPVLTVGPGVTSYSDLNAGAGVSCQYRVRAANAYGVSSYSGTATATGRTAPPVATSIPNAFTIAPFEAWGREKILPIDTNYTLPGGTIYVDSTSGNDSTGTGAVGSPYATLTKAYAVVSSGGTICLRGGTNGAYKAYRESVGSVTKKAIVVCYPHEHVRLKGSDVVTGWVASGSNWKKTSWDLSKLNRTHTPIASGGGNSPYAFPDDVVNASHPAAGYPDGVWVNGEPYSQVLSLPLTPGTKTFYVDVTSVSAAGELWISEDPTGKTVEATTRQFLIKYGTGTSGTRIKGCVIEHYGCTYNYNNLAAVCITGGATLSDIALEDCVGTFNANQVFSIDYGADHKMLNCLIIYNGCLGSHAFATARNDVENCRFAWNNNKHFDIASSSTASIAALKHYGGGSNASGGSPGPHKYINNIWHDNDCNGLWFDVNVYDIIVANSRFIRNNNYPLRFELCPRNIAINNVFADNDKGPAIADGAIAATNTGDLYWYCTSVGNGVTASYGKTQMYIYDDARTSFYAKEAEVIGCVLISTVSTTSCFETYDQSSTATDTGNSLVANNDYNLLGRVTSSGNIWKWERNGLAALGYTSLATFQAATGRETHSVVVDGVAKTAMFVDPVNGNYALKSAYQNLVTPPPLSATALARLGIAGPIAPTIVGASDSLGVLLGYGNLPPAIP